MSELTNKIFHPSNLGGMEIKWCNPDLSECKSGEHTFIECCGTVSDVDESVILDVYNQEQIDNAGIDIEKDDIPVYAKIDLTYIIQNDLEWIEMQNKSLDTSNYTKSRKHPHYIDINSLDIQYIEISTDFKFIRIHYNFCQNHFGCSSKRRMMSGSLHSLFEIQRGMGNPYKTYHYNVDYGAQVYW